MRSFSLCSWEACSAWSSLLRFRLPILSSPNGKTNVADDIDVANERAELFLQDALTHRPKPTPIPAGIGLCLECGADTERGRWCSVACRDEWERVHG